MYSADDRVASLNKLLGNHRLALLHDSENNLVYVEQQKETAAKFKGLTPEDMLIHNLIRDSGEATVPLPCMLCQRLCQRSMASRKRGGSLRPAATTLPHSHRVAPACLQALRASGLGTCV